MNKVNSLYKFLKKEGHLFEAELLQRIIKKADSVDFILRKKAEEDSDKMELILSEDEFYPLLESKFEIEYIGFENAWDQTEWIFAINGEEIKFTSYPSEGADSIAWGLADFVGLKAGLAYHKHPHSKVVSWGDEYDSADDERKIYEKLLPYIQNIKRLPSDLIEAQKQMDSYHKYEYGYYDLDDEDSEE